VLRQFQQQPAYNNNYNYNVHVQAVRTAQRTEPWCTATNRKPNVGLKFNSVTAPQGLTRNMCRSKRAALEDGRSGADPQLSRDRYGCTPSNWASRDAAAFVSCNSGPVETCTLSLIGRVDSAAPRPSTCVRRARGSELVTRG